MSTIDDVSNKLSRANTVVIDVETNGLDWRNNHIVGYVFTFGSNPDDSHYLPVRHESGPNLDAGRVRSMILSHMDRPRHWVGHNLAFDLGFLHAEGITLNGTFEDTMINAALLDEFRRSFSLENCADEAGVQSKKATEIKQHIEAYFDDDFGRNYMGQYWRLPADDEVAIAYAVGDGTTTWQLWVEQTRQIEEQNLGNVHSVECRVIPVLNRMTMRGIRIDVDRVHRLRVVMQESLDKAQQSLGEEINVNSPAQIHKLHERHGESGWPLTPTGKPSFPEEYLRTTEIGRKVITVRKAKRMLEAFIDPMIDRHMYKGRVHASFNQLRGDEFGTVTGRLSSSNPNLQQVPKRDEEAGVLFRSIFLPDDGMIWGSADYSQCEPRLLAHYSGCKVLVDGYTQQPSVDAHTAVANAANIDRQSGKRLNQALLTGAGAKKAASMLGKPMDEAMEIVNQYFKSMPEIKILQAEASSVLRKRGYVMSILGRRSRLEAPGFEYKAVNRLLQCSNADMIKLSMVRIDEMCRSLGDIDMLNNVHDSLDFQYTPDREKAYREALEIMCDFPQIRVPIEIEEDSGPDWAWASYGEKSWRKIMADKGML
jgi:DNA polymerase-1